MNIINLLHKEALEKVARELATWKEFQDAEPMLVTISNNNLPEEIVAIGGKLEHWESEASGVYYLELPGNSFMQNFIGSYEESKFFLANVGDNQYIFKVTNEKEISVVKEKDIPEVIFSRLRELAMANVMYASLEK